MRKISGYMIADSRKFTLNSQARCNICRCSHAAQGTLRLSNTY